MHQSSCCRCDRISIEVRVRRKKAPRRWWTHEN
jgi:hypothetical protein